ncbi:MULTISPECIES: DUF2946 domain-containing protein [unclassified Brenneria]|uniref:DUF2946 domain-containing protein n=1 Tax=unclassified Brenneria TaxID=2634434 RepID=UPI001556A734|nr:DUF2946 domain-containing protein [Brenneria sp. hezel4-2-4]MEE3650247.1 DUF2946 domain-containing protein [Brenneria sp. HEZEL_4_2_4]NPD00203.1 DUF2946 domain-containing protein [Brenneria sp. hezel4-2-4]
MLLSLLRRRGFPAWLGIFAILTLSIAPVISQTLAYGNDGTEQALNTSPISAEHHHAGHTPSGSHASHPQHSSSPQPASMTDHAACGYCVLLAHTPVLAAVDSIIIVLKPSISNIQAVTFVSLSIPIARFASPVPRAPPH